MTPLQFFALYEWVSKVSGLGKEITTKILVEQHKEFWQQNSLD
jgi:hypothetical protein